MAPDFNIALAPAAAVGGLDQLDIAPLGGGVPAPAASAVPPELLGVLDGNPAAVRVPSPEMAPGDPVVEYAAANFEELLAVGINFYDALDGTTVFFNPEMLDEATLAQLDQEGALDSVAALVGTGGAPMAPMDPMAPMAPAPTGGGGLPAAASNRMAGARVSNVGATGPSPKNPLHGLGARAY